jgi:hypothetical protein
MRLQIAIASFLFSCYVYGGQDEIIGTWAGGDRAAESIYGTLTISKSSISWGGTHTSSPTCKASYLVEHEDFGVAFKDQTGNTYVTSADSKFQTYLLSIKSAKCARGLSHLRLTLREDLAGYLAVVEYDRSNREIGWIHFFKR